MKYSKMYIMLLLFVILFGVQRNTAIVFAEETQEQWITITFMDSDHKNANVLKEVQIHPGETVEFPEIVKETGTETFSYWYGCDTNGNYIGEVDETTQFYQDIFIYPHYLYHLTPEDMEREHSTTEQKYYRVIIDLGQEVNELVNRTRDLYVSVDETKNLITLLGEINWLPPTWLNHTFVGWFTEAEGGTEIDENTYVNSDMVIYAHWKVDDGIYKLQYHLNYNMDGEDMPYQSGWYEKIPELPVLEREGYIFTGWWYYITMETYSRCEAKAGNKLKKNTDIYAHWKKVEVKKAAVKKMERISRTKLKVSLKKVKGADGYQIMCSKNKKFKKKTSRKYTTKKATKTIKINKKMKYIKVRAYQLDSTGKKVYGEWSKVKKIKQVKKKSQAKK